MNKISLRKILNLKTSLIIASIVVVGAIFGRVTADNLKWFNDNQGVMLWLAFIAASTATGLAYKVGRDQVKLLGSAQAFDRKPHVSLEIQDGAVHGSDEFQDNTWIIHIKNSSRSQHIRLTKCYLRGKLDTNPLYGKGALIAPGGSYPFFLLGKDVHLGEDVNPKSSPIYTHLQVEFTANRRLYRPEYFLGYRKEVVMWYWYKEKTDSDYR